MAGLIHVPVENIGDIQVLAAGGPADLNRPCVTCGLITGNFCDGQEYHGGVPADGPPCLAADRVPAENWLNGQRTPFCSRCEPVFIKCRFCLGIFGPTPPAHGHGPQ
jgi:hypothetical protein